MAAMEPVTVAVRPAPPKPRARRASDGPPSAPGVLGLYLAFWHYASGQRPRVILSSTLLVASQLVKLAIPWLAAQAINTIQTGGPGSTGRAGALILAIVATASLSWSLHGPGRVIERNVGVHVRRRLADGLYAKVGRLSLPWHESHHTGETLGRMQKTTFALSDFAQNQFIYLQNIVNLIGPIVALAVLSWITGAIAIVGYILVGAVIITFDRSLMRLARRENDAVRRYDAALVDFLANIQSVLALRLQMATRTLLGRRIEAVVEPLRQSIRVVEYKWACVDLLTIGLTWGLVAAYAMAARSGSAAAAAPLADLLPGSGGTGATPGAAAAGALMLGNVFMVYQYAQQAGGVIGSLAANFQQFARYQTDYASADPIMAARDAPSPGVAIDPEWRRIALRDVGFRHANAREERPGLDAITLELRRGEKLALIGPSGAGKSTLMRVIAGLYRADRGGWEIDGERQPGLRDLSGIATFIPQEAEVFEASVRDNVTFGNEPGPDRLERALRVAMFEPVLAAMPEGLETPIVERGSNLSGGQKQRLALTRGLLAADASSIILLDEPTSALDPLTETRVFESLRAQFPETTVVASVHRLSLLPHFDRVVLMQAGRVLDVGTPDELTARQPLFRELVRGAARTEPGATPTSPAGASAGTGTGTGASPRAGANVAGPTGA